MIIKLPSSERLKIETLIEIDQLNQKALETTQLLGKDCLKLDQLDHFE